MWPDDRKRIFQSGHGENHFELWTNLNLLRLTVSVISLAEKQREMPQFDFEVHIDVGENGATRDMIQELVGAVRANNFEAKTKPDSYAASKVADRHTK